MYKNEVKNIVEEVYPLIKQYYGKSKFNGKAPKVDYHHNIYARITGVDEAEGDCSPSAEFERETNTIWIYYPEMKSDQDIIQTIIHEYTHYLQDGDEMKRLYDEEGYEYDNHPFELDAIEAESDWEIFISSHRLYPLHKIVSEELA
jgi:hypothetical protein